MFSSVQLFQLYRRNKVTFYTRPFKESQVSPSKSSSCFRISLILGSHVSINFEAAGSAACEWCKKSCCLGCSMLEHSNFGRLVLELCFAESLILVHVIIHAASYLLRHKILSTFCVGQCHQLCFLSSWRLQCLSLWKRCRHQLGYRRRSSSPLHVTSGVQLWCQDINQYERIEANESSQTAKNLPYMLHLPPGGVSIKWKAKQMQTNQSANGCTYSFDGACTKANQSICITDLYIFAGQRWHEEIGTPACSFRTYFIIFQATCLKCTFFIVLPYCKLS